MARSGETMATNNSSQNNGDAHSDEHTGLSTAKTPRDRVIDALMELAAERRFEEITLTDIAARAKISLADFRDLYPSKGAVLAGFSRRIDRIVLEGCTDDMADELPRERLFDVLMRRLDALAPYRPALQAIGDWAKRDPISAAALNRLTLNSMRFMLEAAAIENDGPAGSIKLQGLVIAWTRVLSVWFRDEDPGFSATMADLDRELSRGERLIGHATDLGRLFAPIRTVAHGLFEAGLSIRRGRRARRSERDEQTSDI